MIRICVSFVVFVVLWKVHCMSSLPGCIIIRTAGNVSTDDVIIIDENNFINVTLFINTSACGHIALGIFKISEYYGGNLFDVCKVVLTDTSCQETRSSRETCYCLSYGQHSVQFHKSWNGSDSKVYELRLTQESKTLVSRRMRFVIQKTKTDRSAHTVNRTEQAACAGFCIDWPTILVSCLCAAVVITFIACVVRRCRRTRERSVNNTEDRQDVCSEHLYDVAMDDVEDGFNYKAR